jgi:AcrR family transcriptional regulator
MTELKDSATKKEDRRVRRTKKLLTQALMELLPEKQINEITVKELTDLAYMNRGTFYLYYKDIFDMLEKIEDGLFAALDDIVSLHEKDDVSRQPKPILLDLFRFIGENREICSVLLSPHGDMNFLHRLNDVVREKCLQMWPNEKEKERFSPVLYTPAKILISLIHPLLHIPVSCVQASAISAAAATTLTKKAIW